MFTGIIQKTGRVKSVSPASTGSVRLVLDNPFQEFRDSDPILIGESIANNGVCLTVVSYSPDAIEFDLAPETLRITALSRLKAGSKVNLERAMKAGDRFSGHWVQGHVDGTGVVEEVQSIAGGCFSLRIRVERQFLKYCVEKGSFTIDGISLTVHGIVDQCLQFQIIPHTWAVTALSDLYRGDLVNFEVDILAKYIERLKHDQST